MSLRERLEVTSLREQLGGKRRVTVRRPREFRVLGQETFHDAFILLGFERARCVDEQPAEAQPEFFTPEAAAQAAQATVEAPAAKRSRSRRKPAAEATPIAEAAPTPVAEAAPAKPARSSRKKAAPAAKAEAAPAKPAEEPAKPKRARRKQTAE